MSGAPRALDCRGRPLSLGGAAALFGILNLSPDSFYDGGRVGGPEAALEQGRRLAREGAAAIDVGGQSTRPGHAEVSAAEETARVRPVVEALAAELEIPVSVDTYKPEVAWAALAAGAHLLNDVRGFQGDPAMAQVAAEFGCPVILMHWEAGFAAAPGDPLPRLGRYFARSLELARAAGVPAGRIILDPGIGFAKTGEQSLEIMARLGELRSLGCPLMLGASMKSVIGRALGLPEPADRLEGTLATTVLAVSQGVECLRVHDVQANLRAARMAEAVLKFRR
ncbi:MAG TPA: dihydropteroate synthase [Opitutaceae bacterium]|nr:dihydropteroate synthase [Opitutaceae bacterium]